VRDRKDDLEISRDGMSSAEGNLEDTGIVAHISLRGKGTRRISRHPFSVRSVVVRFGKSLPEDRGEDNSISGSESAFSAAVHVEKTGEGDSNGPIMAISITGPACGRDRKVLDDLAGKRIKCPCCGQAVVAAGSRPPAPVMTTHAAASQPLPPRGKKHSARRSSVGPEGRLLWRWVTGLVLAVAVLLGPGVFLAARRTTPGRTDDKAVASLPTTSQPPSSDRPPTAPADLQWPDPEEPAQGTIKRWPAAAVGDRVVPVGKGSYADSPPPENGDKNYADMIRDFEAHEKKPGTIKQFGPALGSVMLGYVLLYDLAWVAEQLDTLWADPGDKIAHEASEMAIISYMAHPMRRLGRVDWNCHTNSPTSMVYREPGTRTYGVWNPQQAPRTVEVYEEGKVIGRMVPAPQALTHVTTLSVARQ
jgi:hypothetical protein